jgi:thiamine pyrophosphokinase
MENMYFGGYTASQITDMQTTTNRLPDAIICLDGEFPGADFFSAFPSVPLIAADGAALQLQNLSLVPAIIIGDMDTLRASGHSNTFADVPRLFVENQDKTDYEKCLDYCLAQELSAVLVCGIHGGEMEHSLNNWSITIRYAEYIHLCLYDGYRYGLPLSAPAELPTQPGDTISLIPQPSVRLTTEGLHWPLIREELRLGVREGARNRATATSIKLDIHEGSMLVFCRATLPHIPIVQRGDN